MSTEKFYLVVDQSSEECYHQIGIFSTIRAAYFQTHAQLKESKESPLYAHYDVFDYVTETIKIFEQVEGFNYEGELGKEVCEIIREHEYNDDADEFYYVITSQTPLQEVIRKTGVEL